VTEGFDFAPNIAIFCDFENVAIGVRDARFDRFDIHLALERLLDKGKIVVKKAYADWDRYKSSKRSMHEAGFELIEIPHISLSGKNSADIRLVVDALDLCHTKSHVDVFVIISGDSDFSPLVSKLRENNKKVIAMGVKNSSSDLLIENCDEFIYYDDLVRRQSMARKGAGERDRPRTTRAEERREVEERKDGKDAKETENGQADLAQRQEEAMKMVLDTVEALFRDRDDNLWGSIVKQTLKRKRPNFAESFHGYRNFNQLLEDAQRRKLLEIQKDERSGGYIIVDCGPEA
jgi:uncharacterized protein (TIGR00288 family)